MALRNEKVGELPEWSEGKLTSTRQSDDSSCGPFVLLVGHIVTTLCIQSQSINKFIGKTQLSMTV